MTFLFGSLTLWRFRRSPGGEVSSLGSFGVRWLAAIGFAFTALVAVLIVPSTPSEALPCTPYTCGVDPGTGPISFTVKAIAHMTLQVEATTWPPVIGQTDFIRWNTNLQENITGGNVIVDFDGPGGPIQSTTPVCGATNSRSPVIPASGPNVWAGGFVVWPVGTPASTAIPPCPINAGQYDTGLVPFTIPDSVQPGTYTGTIQITDQTGSTVLLTGWQIALLPPTTTTLSSSANPSVVGQPTTFMATVAPVPPATGTPTGTVTFNDGADAIPGCAGLTLNSSGAATCTTSALPAGTDSITATYSGDSTFAQSTSNPPLSQTVVGCAAGQTSHLLTATTNAGQIYGLFCVNRFGLGTYTQGPVSGTGLVEQALGGTVAVSHGADLNLAGLSFGQFSVFTETAPLRAHGTFSLSG
jgi:hypothetical protein